jgi:hypothetical protein
MESEKEQDEIKLSVEESWQYCFACLKPVKYYFIRLSDENWILINPNDAQLDIKVCPKTVWIAVDLKEDKHPELKEVFKLCEEGRVKDLIEILNKLRANS